MTKTWVRLFWSDYEAINYRPPEVPEPVWRAHFNHRVYARYARPRITALFCETCDETWRAT